MDEPGGMLTYGIPPYRLPKDVVRNQVKALERMGIQLKLRVDAVRDNGLEELMKSYDAVFLACGAWKERPSGIAGEQLMMSGTEFLRNSNLGTREVPGKKVAVIGGGNVAIDIARTLNLEGANLYCLKHTVKTGLARLGVTKEIRDRVMNHSLKQSDVGDGYNHHTYYPECYRALSQWQDRLRDIIDGKRRGNVITLSSSSRP